MSKHKEPPSEVPAERGSSEPVRLAESPRLELLSVDEAPDIPTSDPTGGFDRWLHAQNSGKYVDPGVFLAHAQRKEGSWWPEWHGWLSRHSGPLRPAPSMGAADKGYVPVDAPGTCVLMR